MENKNREDEKIVFRWQYLIIYFLIAGFISYGLVDYKHEKENPPTTESVTESTTKVNITSEATNMYEDWEEESQWHNYEGVASDGGGRSPAATKNKNETTKKADPTTKKPTAPTTKKPTAPTTKKPNAGGNGTSSSPSTNATKPTTATPPKTEPPATEPPAPPPTADAGTNPDTNGA